MQKASLRIRQVYAVNKSKVLDEYTNGNHQF